MNAAPDISRRSSKRKIHRPTPQPHTVTPHTERLGEGAPLTQLLQCFRGRDGLVAFDGRWGDGCSILSFQPFFQLSEASELDTFTDLDTFTSPPPHGFIGGGFFGYLGFDAFERTAAGHLPTTAMGYYPWVLRTLPGTQEWCIEYLWCTEYDRYLTDVLPVVRQLMTSPQSFDRQDYRLFNFRAPDPEIHLRAVERTKLAIRRGDIFQANICTRFTGQFQGDPLDLFTTGVQRMAPDWSGFVATKDGAVISFSPELFMRRAGSMISTAPIKGTSPRTGDPAHDSLSYDQLQASVKDHAENTMIVDLMRNDFGVFADSGSVTVVDLHQIEPHPNVWHLVSTIEAKVPNSVSTYNIVKAAFPPGSVSGTPKPEALKVIGSVEAEARGAYTGIAGYMSATGRAEFNVLIRTFELYGQTISIGTGGGIVDGSDPLTEWEECIAKAKPLIDRLDGEWSSHPSPSQDDGRAAVFDTALAVDGTVVDAAAHEARIHKSSLGATPRIPRTIVHRAPREIVRVTATATGRTVLERHQAAPETTLTLEPVDLEPVMVENYRRPHKLVDRTRLEQLEAKTAATGALPLLIDPTQRLIETTRTGLLVVEPSGRVVIPASLGKSLDSTTARRTALLATEQGLSTDVDIVRLSDLTCEHSVLVASAIAGVRIARRVGPLRFRETSCATTIAKNLAAAYRTYALKAPTATASMEHFERTIRWRFDRCAQRRQPYGLETPKVLLIDNRDSFVQNLRHQLQMAGADVVIAQAHGDAPTDLAQFDALVISPGPLAPTQSGIALEMIGRFAGDRPILGVCLGHQYIGSYFGASVVAAPWPQHGMASEIIHDGAGVLTGVPQRFRAARYHSLCLDPTQIPSSLNVCAVSSDGDVMAVRATEGDITGVQFHPESILTSEGLSIIANFVDRARPRT